MRSGRVEHASPASTLSGAPNFAYELCVRRIPDAALEELDLSSWRLAYNCAEPVNPATIEGFIGRFARHGFRREAMTPAYGLAECSVDLAVSPPQRGPRIDRVQRQLFMQTGAALAARADDSSALLFVGCGPSLPGHELRIVDATGGEAGDRQQGRLEFRGPSATQGYLRKPEQTSRLIRDGWLDSGDLAYIADGELYVTGRSKDLIIRGGRHIHPYELEAAVGALDGVRRGCVAVFGSPDPVSGTERVIVLAETRVEDAAGREKLRSRIGECAVDVLGVPADDIVLAPVQTVLKTSSGKIRRAASREFYERGGRGARRPPAWWQLVRLGLAALVPTLSGMRYAISTWAYAGYAQTMIVAWFLPSWLAVVALPRATWRWHCAHMLARALLRVLGIPLAVAGLEHIGRGSSYVVTANHSSYLDGLVLTEAWSEPLRFVAKAELRRQFWAGTLLRRLGTEFVERFDAVQGVADAGRLVEAALRGQPLMLFPEGTFTRRPGLAAFHLGAFATAAQAGIPVIPVAIRGTRSILRGDSRVPRRGSVAVEILEPQRARDASWDAVLDLRDAVRVAIAGRCAEPDLQR